MSRRSSIRLRAAIFATLVFGSTIPMPAQDNATTTTAPRTTADQDSIAKAKREFEALKSTRDPKLQPREGLPQVNVPQWHGTVETSPPLVGPQAKQKNAAKQKNWLVDAMEKPSDRSHGNRNGESLRTRDRDTDEFGNPRERGDEDELLPANEADEKPERAEDIDERERRTRTAAANPLERYLGEWMTPSDLALLKPVLSDESSDALGQAKLPSADFAHGGVGGVALPVELMSDVERTAKSPLVSPTPAPNPYLSALTPPQIAVPSIAPKTAPPPVVSITPPPVAAPTNAPSRSKIPEFAKPPTDEKYFKQLKRF